MATEPETSSEAKVGTPCAHCGTPCGKGMVTHDHSAFCCRGCAMVYDILNENGLNRYYELDETAGKPQNKSDDHGRYDFFAEVDVRQKLIQFSDGKQSRVSFHIPGIHCVACVWLLERLYVLNEGIGQPEVQFTKKTITIPFNEEQISLVELANLLDKIGYPPEFSLNDLEQAPVDRSRRRYWMQLGVAGFAFGNIMLYSFPSYLGLQVGTTSWLAPLFGWISLLLSIPVLTYSAQDYFRSAWLGIRHRELSVDVPIALGILALFGQSAFDIVTGYGEGYLDSLAGLLFFLLIGKGFQKRTFDELSFDRDYRSYFPIAATQVLRNGGTSTLSLNRVQAGDRLRIRNGELVPADAILVNGPALIDYSFVTGESTPEERISGDYLYAGGRHTGAPIDVDVVKEVSQSYLTSLWNHKSFQKDHERKLDRWTHQVGGVFTFVVLGIATCTAVYWGLTDPSKVLRSFTSVLIVACPCALALSAPFAFGSALRILRREGLYLKNGAVVEGMARASDVIFDKTGTLTHGGIGHVTFEPVGEDVDWNPAYQSATQTLAAASTHPLSRAIAESLPQNETNPPKSMRELNGKGIEGWVDDHHVRLGSRAWFGEMQLNIPPGKQARAESWLCIDGKILGRFMFDDPVRPGLEHSWSELATPYDLHILTGDSAEGAARLPDAIGGIAHLRAGQSPSEKRETVSSLQDAGRSVIMVGDGLNDAGALKQSDVGIAVSDDIQSFTPACDAILHAKNVHRLPSYLSFSTRCVHVVFASFAVSLSYNVIGITVAAMGMLSPLFAAILMPLSSVTVLILAVSGTVFAAKRSHLYSAGDATWK